MLLQNEYILSMSGLPSVQLAILFDFPRHAGIARAPFSPAAQAADLFVHSFGQRDGLRQGRFYVFGRQILLCIEGVVKRTIDGLLDFRAAKLSTSACERFQVEFRGIPAPPGD